jgi:hypothetical protein
MVGDSSNIRTKRIQVAAVELLTSDVIFFLSAEAMVSAIDQQSQLTIKVRSTENTNAVQAYLGDFSTCVFCLL